MNVMDFLVDIAVNGDGKLIFVAGSPSVGKSTLMTLIAKALTLWGVPVGYFSLEMPCEQLARKMMLPHARLDEDKLIFTTELLKLRSSKKIFYVWKRARYMLMIQHKLL